MSVYKRGKFYWYRFKFNGQVIRVGTKSKSRDVAEKAERNRRLALAGCGKTSDLHELCAALVTE